MISTMNHVTITCANIPDQDPLEALKKHAILAIVASFIMATSISVVCLAHGCTIIFQNSFYIPILITALYYPRKGLILAFLASVVYLLLILFVGPGLILIFAALIRIFFFLVVTAVTVHISLRREKAEKALHNQLENLEELVKEQTKFISEKLERSHQLKEAYKKGNEYYEKLFMQSDAPVALWNTDLYITAVNAAFCSYCNYDRSELIGRNITTILPFEHREIRYFPVQLEIPSRVTEHRRSLWIISRIQAYDNNETLAYMAVGMELPSAEILTV